MVAGTFCHGDADAVFIEVETIRAGAAVHRQEVRNATLLHGAEGSAGQLASLMLVREYLRRWAVPGVFICFMHRMRGLLLLIRLYYHHYNSNYTVNK